MKKVKKFFLVCIFILLTLQLLSQTLISFALSEPVTGVTLDKTSIDTYVGRSYQLIPSVLPFNASDKRVTYISSGSSVSVDLNGIIRAESAGTSIITVTTVDGNKTAACVVNVKEAKITSGTYSISDSTRFMRNILKGTTAKNMLPLLTSTEDVAVTDAGGVLLPENTVIATGMKLRRVKDTQVLYEISTIIDGDVNGDTQSDIIDLIQVKNKMLGNADLDGPYLAAGDMDQDGDLTILDLLTLKENVIKLEANRAFEPELFVATDNSAGIVYRDTSSVRSSNYTDPAAYLSFYSHNRDTGYSSDEIFQTGINESFLYITKDENIYQGTSATYWVEGTNADNGKLVGNYHLEIDKNYTSFKEVQNIISTIRLKGFKAFPAYFGSCYRVRIGSYASSSEALADQGRFSFLINEYFLNVKASANTTTCMTAVNAMTGDIVFEYDVPGNNYLRVSPGRDSELLHHRYNNRLATNLTNYGKLLAGDLIFKRDQKDTGKRVAAVNAVRTQEYLKGVITKEIYADKYENNYNTYIEAFKAHAVSSRNFAYTAHKHYSSNYEVGADICDTTDCQVYEYETDTLTSRIINDSVNMTNGLVAKNNGTIVPLYYSSTNGGASVTNGEAWYIASGGVYVKGTDLPYIKAVTDEFDDDDLPSRYVYQTTVTYAKSALRDKFYNGGVNNKNINEYPSYLADTATVESAVITKRNAVGVPVEMEFICNNGKKVTVWGGEHIRFGLGLESCNIKNISITGDSIIFTVAGNGHGVGLSQCGAYARSRAGQSYITILNAYYKNLSVYDLINNVQVS